MDAGVVGKKALFVSVEEIGAVVDGGLLAWCAAEHFWAPSVSFEESDQYEHTGVVFTARRLQVAIKVYDCDRPICSIHTTQKRKSNSVISSECDDPGQCFPSF